MKETEINKTEAGKENIRINLLSSKDLDNFIKNLSHPRFLGSIHMNKENMQNDPSLERMIKAELEHKVNHSIKNTMFNPITKALVIITIVFNIIWFSLQYLL
ncbi:MAG: hypothetical protein ACQERB_06035 [Promethearchaeati archaeon]